MSEQSVGVAIFHSHEHAVGGVRELHDTGLNMLCLSVVGKGFFLDNRSVNDDIMGLRMQSWGRLGRYWRLLNGVNAGASCFQFTHLGSVMVAGPLALRVAALQDQSNASEAANPLSTSFVDIGIPQIRIVHYEFLVKMDKVLLIVQGAPDIVEFSRVRLNNVPLEVHSDPLTFMA